MAILERDIVSKHYTSDIVPNFLKEAGGLGIRFIIYRTSPQSGVDAAQWIVKNYGLDRYERAGVPFEIRNAWSPQPEENLDGNPVILTTGSIIDLGKREQFPWIEKFRNTVLREVVNKKLPILAPCYGLAELAALYANDGQDSFPKGVRELGRARIIPTGSNPIFFGLQELTAYVHHNGTVPADLLEANRETIKIEAVSEYSGRILPAMLAFGDSMTLGTSFHREILDTETHELYQRAVRTVVNRLVDSEEFARATDSLRKMDLIPFELDKEGIKRYLATTVTNAHNVQLIQYIEDVVFARNPKQHAWIQGYLDGTTYINEEGYNPQASLVFIDNLVRMYMHRLTNIEQPKVGIGESIKVDNTNEKHRKPLYAFFINGENYFAEVMGTSDAELQEMYEMYIHGFGEHLPMSRDEHKAMAKAGDIIGIRDKEGHMIALRAMVYDRKDSVPDDKHIKDSQAYQNHTIIAKKSRGKGLIKELTRIATSQAIDKGKTAIITSVSPQNIANLVALTRLGYRITIYSPDHFGPDEHRYMLELDLKNKEGGIPDEVLDLRIKRGKIKEFTGDTSELRYYINASDIQSARELLNQDYQGVRVINSVLDGSEQTVIIFERKMNEEEREKYDKAQRRLKDVRDWMKNELDITSIESLVKGDAEWLSCDHSLHNPLRSVLTKAKLSREKSKGEPSKQVINQDETTVHVIDSNENSGTPGVFEALGQSSGALEEIQRLAPKDILQLGSINYFSTVQLIRQLKKLTPTDLHMNLIDICPTVPKHLIKLFNKGLLEANSFSAHNMDALHLQFEDDSFDLTYQDMVGPYVEDPDRLYAEAFRVLRPGGVFITRDRFYMDHDAYVARRNESAPVEPLIDFLYELFPDEETITSYRMLLAFIERQFNSEWDFNAYWDRPLERYIESALKAGFQIFFKPVIVDPDGKGERMSLTMLLKKPE